MESPPPTIPLETLRKEGGGRNPNTAREAGLPLQGRERGVFSFLDAQEKEWIRASPGFAPRALAGLIDGALLCFVVLVVTVIRGALFRIDAFENQQTMISTLQPFASLFFTILFLCYHTVMLGKWGESVGDRLLGIKIVRRQGEPPPFGTAFLRAFAFLVIGAMTVGIPLLLGRILIGSDSVIRFFSAYTFPFLLVTLLLNPAFLWSLLDLKHQGLHDKIAKTFVIRTTS
ncbi:MAG: RDD family protein [Deltaproteobacteria bacterium]|nr:MAG: RDD family protein [Deltaproteobacteria bacterium]